MASDTAPKTQMRTAQAAANESDWQGLFGPTIETKWCFAPIGANVKRRDDRIFSQNMNGEKTSPVSTSDQQRLLKTKRQRSKKRHGTRHSAKTDLPPAPCARAWLHASIQLLKKENRSSSARSHSAEPNQLQ
jgi:hypothetical protein